MSAAAVFTMLIPARNGAAVVGQTLAARFPAATRYSAWRAQAGTRSVWKGRRFPRGSA
jgi:hypothetical protein